MKTKCLISSPSKQDLEKVINDFYYSQNYIITKDNRVYNTKQEKYLPDNISVVVKNNRWQLRKAI